MTNPWDLLYAGFWLVFVVWMIAIRMITTGLDEPESGYDSL